MYMTVGLTNPRIIDTLPSESMTAGYRQSSKGKLEFSTHGELKTVSPATATTIGNKCE